MSRIHYIIMGLLLIGISACSGTNQGDVGSEETTVQTEAVENEMETASDQEIEAPRKEEARTVSKPAPVKPKPVAAKPPQPQYATLSAGTLISVRLQDPLDSAVNQTGDAFSAIVDEDIRVGNNIVVPRGSRVEGKLTEVQRSGRVKGRAAMSMQFESLHIGNSSYPLQAAMLSFEAEGTKKEDAAKVGIGSGIGAAIGAIAGGGKGAAIGAAVGAGAGGATVAATRGKELKYDPEHPFEFTLNEDLKIKIR